MLESADACGVGLIAVPGDVVESTNYSLKKGCNRHSSRGGGSETGTNGCQAGLGMVVLPFDLPLLHYSTPHTAACTPLHF